jgi:hypothetical protein
MCDIKILIMYYKKKILICNRLLSGIQDTHQIIIISNKRLFLFIKKLIYLIYIIDIYIHTSLCHY